MKHTFVFMVAVAMTFPTGQARAKVNEDLTKKWIARGFLMVDCRNPAPQPMDVAQRLLQPAAVHKAWAFLKKCRDERGADSADIVAAENYLYIRYVTGLTGDTAFAILPSAYYALKTAGSKGGFLQRMRTSKDNPVTEPDADVLKWGKNGYEDGIKDYEARTKQKATLKTAAAEVAWTFLADTFYR
jgi:hypothetical protein